MFTKISKSERELREADTMLNTSHYGRKEIMTNIKPYTWDILAKPLPRIKYHNW